VFLLDLMDVDSRLFTDECGVSTTRRAVA